MANLKRFVKGKTLEASELNNMIDAIDEISILIENILPNIDNQGKQIEAGSIAIANGTGGIIWKKISIANETTF